MERQKAALIILFLYLLPVFALSFLHADASASWPLLGFGMLIAAFGSFIFFWLLMPKEEDISLPEIVQEPEKVVELPPELPVGKELFETEMREKQLQWEQQLAAKESQLAEVTSRLAEQEKVGQEQSASLQKEFAQQREQLLNEMDKQRQILVEHYQTILEQRDLLDRKTQQMTHLENKVRDLNYELKTILHITERSIPIQENPAPQPVIKSKREELRPFIDTEVQTEEDAVLQLKRCLEIAQSLAGANHYGNKSPFREFSAIHFALDQRRLFDRLRTEEMSTIFVYSQNDHRMLFVNDQVKLLLGISTERFIQDFTEIVSSGQRCWQDALQQLTFRNEVHVQLPLKSHFGEEIMVECLLGLIPTGLFRNQVIGILFTQHHLQARSNSI